MHEALSAIFADPFINVTVANMPVFNEVLKTVSQTRKFLREIGHQIDDMIIRYRAN